MFTIDFSKHLYYNKTIIMERRRKMGFFDGFKEGLKDKKTERENREIVRLYHEQHELDSDYRSKAFDNAESNGGWYTCAKCGRKFRKKRY